MGNKEQSEKNLYLKGKGQVYGREINLYEEVDTSVSRGVGKQYLWNLQVFESSGNVRLNSVDQGGGTSQLSISLNCMGEKFVSKEGASKNKWEIGKPVPEITFKITQPCGETKGKEVCDIEIAKKICLRKWILSSL